MKKILLVLSIFAFTICNVKAYENKIFKIDVPNSYKKEDVKRDNVYKWTKKNDNSNNIIVTIDNNKSAEKYNTNNFNDEDLEKYSQYIKESIDEELKEYKIEVEVSNVKLETINDNKVISYDIVWPTKKKIGYNTYQKGYTFTTKNYVIVLTISSKSEIKDANIINSFVILDDKINDEKILINPTIKYIAAGLTFGILGIIIFTIILKLKNKRHK